MHTENYINAAAIYIKVINHQRFIYTNEERKEKWKIFEAYINYVFETENLDRELLSNDPTKRKFRLLKFLNEVPNFTKDKKVITFPFSLFRSFICWKKVNIPISSIALKQ